MNEESIKLKPCPFGCGNPVKLSMEHYCGAIHEHINMRPEIWNHRPAEDAKWNEAIERASMILGDYLETAKRVKCGVVIREIPLLIERILAQKKGE